MDVNGPVGRVVQEVAGSQGFAPVAKHVVPRLDRVLNRVTGGRFVLSALLVPSLVLTARGARTGGMRFDGTVAPVTGTALVVDLGGVA